MHGFSANSSGQQSTNDGFGVSAGVDVAIVSGSANAV
jgi:hypothetical protein